MITQPIKQGFTLVEILVVLVLLGFIASLVGVNIKTSSAGLPVVNSFENQVRSLRSESLQTGRIISRTIPLDTIPGASVVAATAYPDGRVLSESDNIDPMSGKTVRSR